ncbi:hypothetical protein FDUTEX481_01706 [Tolypothrix sp. PCC 7601]|nr:hypothetical protein FDUTEX481_01706 [Tolypothrix sp. PCC 7601]
MLHIELVKNYLYIENLRLSSLIEIVKNPIKTRQAQTNSRRNWV